MQYTTVISIDLGQSADPSALSLFFLPLWVHEGQRIRLAMPDAGWHYPDQVSAAQAEILIESQDTRPTRPPPIIVKDLRRWALGTKYPQIVADCWKLLGTLPHPERTAIVIDKTGVGAGVYDMFQESGLAPYGVTITAGAGVTWNDRLVTVPKVDLIGAAQKLLQLGRLQFAARAEGLEQLRNELQNFRMKVNIRTGNTSMEAWREKDHDDMVLSLAIGAWFILDQEARHVWRARDLRALAGRPV